MVSRTCGNVQVRNNRLQKKWLSLPWTDTAANLCPPLLLILWLRARVLRIRDVVGLFGCWTQVCMVGCWYWVFLNRLLLFLGPAIFVTSSSLYFLLFCSSSSLRSIDPTQKNLKKERKIRILAPCSRVGSSEISYYFEQVLVIIAKILWLSAGSD